jgi:hypothetical protein
VSDPLARLRALAELLPRPGCDWESRPTFAPPATPDALAALAAAAGFALPADFTAFLGDTAAVVGMSVHNGYHLGDPERIVAVLRDQSVPRVVNGHPTIPITFDGGGNAFLMTDAGDVWKWDHETGSTTPVARSFATFLDRVASDWATYVADTPGWQFLV